MPQQHLISSEQSSLDRPTHRFKPSFSAFLSLIAAILTSTIFVIEIINPAKLSTTPIQKLPILITFTIFVMISMSFLTTYLILKLSGDIAIESAGINGRNLLSLSTYIYWQDIFCVKICCFFGIRYLLIRSTISKKRHVVLDSFTYNFPKILDRVREYAGDNHPLTIALEKEVSLPRQNPARMLWRIIIGIVIILSTWLIGGNLYADYREKPLNEAIANYVHQHPKTPPNQAAIDLQAAISKLGIPLVVFGDGSKATLKPDRLATQEWKTILPILDEYVPKQLLNKTEDSSSPLPTKLHAYLNSHQAEIDTIQNQLASDNLPSWGSDSAWVAHSNFNAGDGANTDRAYSYNMLQLSRLLIANIFERQQSSDRDIAQQLKIIKNINDSIQNQPRFYEQIIVRFFEKDIYKLFRHFDLTPLDWQENLSDSKRIKMTQIGIEHELLSQVRLIQNPKILMGLAEVKNGSKSPFIYLLKYHHIAQPYTRLMAVNYYQKSKQSLLFWRSQNICRASGYNSDTSVPDGVLDIQVLPRSYITFMTNTLDRELTSSVRQIKSQIRSGGAIDRIASDFKLASQACPGEQWLTEGKDGSITIFLSHPPNWKALGIDEKNNVDRFIYKINPKNT
jgi:hypothetical protein